MLLTVNQIKINVGKVEVLELLVEGLADMFLLVKSVPQLGGDYGERKTVRTSVPMRLPAEP